MSSARPRDVSKNIYVTLKDLRLKGPGDWDSRLPDLLGSAYTAAWDAAALLASGFTSGAEPPVKLDAKTARLRVREKC